MFAVPSPFGFMQVNNGWLFLLVHMTSIVDRKRAKFNCADRDGRQRAKAIIIAYLVHSAGLFAFSKANHRKLLWITFGYRRHVGCSGG